MSEETVRVDTMPVGAVEVLEMLINLAPKLIALALRADEIIALLPDNSGGN